MVQLTTEPIDDWAPIWSPDATEIAFYSYLSGNRDIFVMSSNGGPATQITHDQGFELLTAWSPDGQTLAYQSERSGNPDIWFVPSIGGEPRQVTTHPAFDIWARWSPDGTWVMFVSNRDGEWRLWRMPARGGEPEPIFTIDSRIVAWRWSPDGRHIIFNRGLADFHAFAVADESERRLTDLSGRRGQLGWLALATDSDYLYFTWEEDLGDLWVMDVVTDEE